MVDLSTGVLDRVTFTGSGGDDSIVLGASGANLNGDDDVDVTLTGVELGTASGSGGADLISGAGDLVTGGATFLFLTVNGDSGDDALAGGQGDDTITGGTGSNVLSGGDGDDTLTGGQGDDTLAGGMGGDTLTGGLGNDVFDEGDSLSGTDTMAGGGGNDFLTYAARAAGVTVTMDGVFDDGEAGESDNVGADIEDAIGGNGDNVLVGSTSGQRPDRRARQRHHRRRQRRRHPERRPRQRSRRQAEPATTSSSATTGTTRSSKAPETTRSRAEATSTCSTTPA